MGTFFLLLTILGLGQDGFEKPFNAVPFYFFWGVILRAEFEIRARSGAFAEQAAVRGRAVAGGAVYRRGANGGLRGGVQ